MTVGWMPRLLACAFAIATACSVAIPAAAQDRDPTITLRSFDGFTQLRGELVGFDGSQFTLRTSLGVIQIDALKVNCEGEACPQNLLFGAEFGIHGSNTIGAALMPALIEGYADSLDATLVRELGQQPNETTLRIRHQNGEEMAAIDLRAHGSGTSFDSLAAGTAEIAMSSRRMRRSDAAKLIEAGIGDLRDTPNEHIVAVDGLIVIVHPSNPLEALATEDIARVFAGEITNWAQLGGPDLPINIYARDTNSGTFDTFRSLILGPAGVELSGTAVLFESNAALSDSVTGDPAGIGFTAMAYQRATKALSIRQECGLITAPSEFSIKTEEYPLARRLYLYSLPGTMTAHARQIVDFAQSDAAQPLIQDSGFIDQTSESRPLTEMGPRLIHALTGTDEYSPALMRQLLGELSEARRLSVTFRFTPGASTLTPTSQAAAERLARDLASGVYADQEVLLVGFTDAIGQFDLNRTLALRRAGVVEQAIRAAVPEGALANTQLTVQGYGELTPVGCNSTFEGRFVNRRVEVWIRKRTPA